MSISFSQHAFERTLERLSLEPEEIIAILEQELYIKIGEEKGTNRIHCLFYSKYDTQCFVVVLDEKDEFIITVLPINYYERVAWKIPDQLFDEARKLESKVKYKDKIVTDPPIVFRVFGILMSISDFNKRKTVNLGSWPCINYNRSIGNLLIDLNFKKEVANRIKDKIKDDEYISALLISLGNNGEPVLINWRK